MRVRGERLWCEGLRAVGRGKGADGMGKERG